MCHVNGRDIGWSRVKKVVSVGLHYTARSGQLLDTAIGQESYLLLRIIFVEENNEHE